MAVKSEQINSKGEIVLDYDKYNRGIKIFTPLMNIFQDNITICSRREKPHNKFLLYNDGNKTIVFLVKSVTYLGNPHPKYKKRIQISKWFKEFYFANKDIYDDIRLIGIYYYDGINYFVDYSIEKYMEREAHNSSAHVYSIDFLQTYKDGMFRKTDKNNNILTVIREDNFYEYVVNGFNKSNKLFDKIFNFTEYVPKEYIKSIDAIDQMRLENSNNWRQTEWGGWYLEHIFQQFLEDNNLEEVISFSKANKENTLDLWFPEENFYGDLKANSISSSAILGNDWSVVKKSIQENGKLWYIVMNHKTIKDEDKSATIERTKYINKIDGTDKNTPRRAIKKSIKFEELILIEINKWNINLLDEFQEGMLNSDGNLRNRKFQIKKKHLNNDNLVIARKKIE